MHVEQVMFRSGPVRCAGDLYLPDGVDHGAGPAVVMGHSVVMVKEALGPHAQHLVRNQMTVESLEHVLLWAPVQCIHRLAPTPLLLVTGVDDQVHAIDEVWPPTTAPGSPSGWSCSRWTSSACRSSPGWGSP